MSSFVLNFYFFSCRWRLTFFSCVFHVFCISSLVNYLFIFFASFSFGLSVPSWLIYGSSLYMMDINFCILHVLQIFYPRLPFCLQRLIFRVSFTVYKFYIFMWSNFFFFFFMVSSFYVMLTKALSTLKF